MRRQLTLGSCLALAIVLPATLALAKGPAKAAAPAKPADAKPADAKAAPAKAPAKPPADLPTRVIEKKTDNYIFKLTMRPGSLKPHRVADIELDLLRVLDVPDPVNGDFAPVGSTKPVATIQAPDVPTAFGKKTKMETPDPVSYAMWPLGNQGHYGFHFTPTSDGLYKITVAGTEDKPAEDDSTAGTYSMSFRVGVGSAAPDTEVTEDAQQHNIARRPTSDENDQTVLQFAMGEIGERFLDLEAALAHPPAKGAAAPDTAGDAKLIASFFAKLKGEVPADYSSDSSEFNDLMTSASDQMATIAGMSDRADAKEALAKFETQSCYRCHAKFWYGVTDDVSGWPSFRQKKTAAKSE